MANTGAVIDGGCPGCGRRIVGMMPQRCFYCGYDFTESIRAQNSNFQPDPNYKSPVADAMPSEEEVIEHLKADAEGSAEEITMDEFDRMGKAMAGEMDRQRLVQADAEAKIISIIDRSASMPLSADLTQKFKGAIRDALPGSDHIDVSISEVWDGMEQQTVREVIVKLDLPSDRIVDIEVKKSVKLKGTDIYQ